MSLIIIDDTPAPVPQTVASLPNGASFAYNAVLYAKSLDGTKAIRIDSMDIIPVSNFGSDAVIRKDLTELHCVSHL